MTLSQLPFLPALPPCTAPPPSAGLGAALQATSNAHWCTPRPLPLLCNRRHRPPSPRCRRASLPLACAPARSFELLCPSQIIAPRRSNLICLPSSTPPLLPKRSQPVGPFHLRDKIVPRVCTQVVHTARGGQRRLQQATAEHSARAGTHWARCTSASGTPALAAASAGAGAAGCASGALALGAPRAAAASLTGDHAARQGWGQAGGVEKKRG